MLCVLIVLSLNSITYMSLSFGCVLVVNIVVNMCVCVRVSGWVSVWSWPTSRARDILMT